MTFISLIPPVYFNVKSYQAVCNGTSDDTTFVQNTIAATQAAGGGWVYLPGPCGLSNTLTVTADNVGFLGSGRGSGFVALAGFPAAPMLWVKGPGGAGNFRQGARIANMLFSNTVTSGATGIQLDSTYYASLTKVDIEGVYATNLYLNGIGGAFGAYTSLTDCHLGALPGGAGSGGVGILTNNHEHCVIRGGVINWFNVSGGIGAKVQNSACQFENVAFDECDTTLDFEFCVGNQVIGCDFDRGLTRFIYLHGAKNTHIQTCQFGSFVGSGSKNMIFAEDSGNASNVVEGCIALASSGWTNFVSENSGIGSPPNSYIGNDIAALGIVRQNGLFARNRGYNPVGPLSAPTIPSTGTAQTNTFGVDAMVVVTGGTVSSIAIGGTATGLTSGSFRVPAQQTITLTYTSAPSWTWFGD